jgi:hypothetical protein
MRQPYFLLKLICSFLIEGLSRKTFFLISNRKGNNVIFIICLSLSVSGCSALTKNQVGAVNQFAQTSMGFSAYPSKILSELAEVREKRGVYFAYSLTDPELHIRRLDSVYARSGPWSFPKKWT